MSNPFTAAPEPPAPADKPAPEQAPAGQPPAYLTRQELEAWWKERLPEASEAGFRRMQGYIDSTQKSIRDAVSAHDAFLQNLKATGVTLTPQQEEASRQQVVQKAQAAATAQPAQPPADYIDPVSQRGLDLEKQLGITLDETDEEAALIKVDGTEDEYLTTYKAALLQKKARSTLAPAPPQPTPSPPTRLPSSPASSSPVSSLSQAKTPDDIWALVSGNSR